MSLQFFKFDFLRFDFLKTIKSPEQRKAWFVAILADAIQIVGMPLFVEGGLSPLDTGLDVIVGAILIKLLGWHWAFLPTFAAELVPGLDLFPTWTAAVFFATRKLAAENEPEIIDRGRARTTTEPEILEPGPAPARRV
jgi:fatty acid desaturase